MDAKKRTQPPSASCGGCAEGAGTKRPRQLDDDIEDMDVMDAEMFGSNEQEEFIPEDEELVLRPSSNQQRGQYRPRFRYSRPPLPEGGINPSTTNLGMPGFWLQLGCLLVVVVPKCITASNAFVDEQRVAFPPVRCNSHFFTHPIPQCSSSSRWTRCSQHHTLCMTRAQSLVTSQSCACLV